MLVEITAKSLGHFGRFVNSNYLIFSKLWYSYKDKAKSRETQYFMNNH